MENLQKPKEEIIILGMKCMEITMILLHKLILIFVPKRNFLTKTLGYFRDPVVAFVGTPQIYGNTSTSLIAQGAAEQLYTFYGSVDQD